jgi:acyl dehydratase
MNKISYEQLTTGFTFPPSQFEIDARTVKDYLQAVGGDFGIYDGIVPPMAIAALAMAAMGESFELLPGTVHVTQELEFTSSIKIGEILTSYAKVNRKVIRGKFHMLTVGINVVDRNNETVVTGETGFILPS